MIKEITLKHLARAIHERNKAAGVEYDCAGTCLIAQAAKEVYGKENLDGVGVTSVRVLNGSKLSMLRLSKKIQKLINLFDYSDKDFGLDAQENMAKLRSILPVHVRFPKVA